MQRTHIIAEIGINHNGDLNIAKKLIDIASISGCDCVKFQKRNPDVCVPKHQKNVIRETPWGTMTYLEYKHRIEFKKEQYDQIKKVAVEHFATNPSVKIKELALELGINERTIVGWRTDPNFMDAIYDRYMVLFGGELPAVLNAMIREAKSGNVQAGRLVLEHSGKLVKNINVTVDSPFEKYLKTVDIDDVEDAEIVEMMEEIPIIESLPERDIEPPVKRNKREKNQIDDAIKKEQYNQKRKEWYKWKKRAIAVGVEPLSARRPTKGQRKTWEDEIIKRESENEG